MAIEKVDVGVSDSDMFRSAMADEPKAEPEVQSEERLRDELGRFAPKAEDAPVAAIEQQPAQVTEQPPPKDEAHVPSWRLREQREEWESKLQRELEQRDRNHQAQLAQLQQQWQQSQPQPEPVDFFADPDAAMHQRVTPLVEPLMQQLNQLQGKLHRMQAAQAFGPELNEFKTHIAEMMQRGDPEYHALSTAMERSEDPFGTAKQWYQQRKLLKETGGDLTAYLAKKQDDLLKDPAFLAKALDAARAQAGQPGNAPKVQIPPSLNRASGSAGNSENDPSDMSDASLWAASRPTGRRK